MSGRARMSSKRTDSLDQNATKVGTAADVLGVEGQKKECHPRKRADP